MSVKKQGNEIFNIFGWKLTKDNAIISMRAEIAQVVEQLSRNQQVVGSSPIFGTITK